jgi:Zn-dependent alcohol dehydrogenase
MGDELGRYRRRAQGAVRRGDLMPLSYRAAVLHAAQTPLSIETVTAAPLKPADVLVRIRATGLCHTDLEVIDGSLRYPLPIVVGHEAAGVVEQVGSGARLAGAGKIIAVDLNPAKLALAAKMGATHGIDASKDDAVALAKKETGNRGVDVVIESAGNPAAFRLSTEAVRPGGQVIWLGKIDVNKDVSFRWGSLMQEKRIRRVSYGNARPRRDFPLLARAYLDGSLLLDDLISRRIALEDINDGFAALRRNETIRSVVTFG